LECGGSAPREILKMVLRQSLGLVVMGVAVGAAAALAGTRALTSLLVGISPSDPATFVAVVILLSGVVLRACWIPAQRATRVRPLVALRYE
jgi:putative ABC transport system permease protein